MQVVLEYFGTVTWQRLFYLEILVLRKVVAQVVSSLSCCTCMSSLPQMKRQEVPGASQYTESGDGPRMGTRETLREEHRNLLC